MVATETLGRIIEKFEKGEISADKPETMKWFSEQMMKAIEELERETEKPEHKEKLAKLHGEFEVFARCFEALGKERK